MASEEKSMRIPVDVIREARQKSETYRVQSKRLLAEAEKMRARAELLDTLGLELHDMVNGWIKSFPETVE